MFMSILSLYVSHRGGEAESHWRLMENKFIPVQCSPTLDELIGLIEEGLGYNNATLVITNENGAISRKLITGKPEPVESAETFYEDEFAA
jgi:hypothetical protein